MPRSAPYSGASVAREPSPTILNTVAAVDAIVHSASATPALSQVVPSVCLTGAPSTRCHASATAGSTASDTRASTALTAPSEIGTPTRSDSSLAAFRRLTW